MDNKLPKISVIVPVYNTEKYLSKCLDSIVNQSYENIEIIIVNDGSTDDSEKIIKEYEQKYPNKIKYFKKENGGLSSARNYGILKSAGEYISFVDSDDYIDINLFKQLEDEIKKSIDLIKFKLIKVNEEYAEIEKIGGPIFEKESGQDAFNKLAFCDELLEPACLYLYKKELFIKNKFEFALGKYHEDFGLIPLIIINANTVSSKDVYGYIYMQSENSITRGENYKKTCRSCKDLLYHYDNMIQIINKINLKQKTKNNIKQYYTNSIILAAKKLKEKEQDEYILEIKKRKLIKNIKAKNIKSAIKKCILYINIKMYLKLK